MFVQMTNALHDCRYVENIYRHKNSSLQTNAQFPGSVPCSIYLIHVPGLILPFSDAFDIKMPPPRHVLSMGP